MKRTIFFGVALAIGLGAAFADGDAISARRALMKANGEAAKGVGAMMKGESPFDLAAVQKALATFADAAGKMPALFPADSKTGDTHATAAAFDNAKDRDAKFAKFGADSKAAMAAIKDEASFKATMPGVFENCGGCHELYKQKT